MKTHWPTGPRKMLFMNLAKGFTITIYCHSVLGKEVQVTRDPCSLEPRGQIREKLPWQADVLDLLCQHLSASGRWGGFLFSDHLTERNTPNSDIWERHILKGFSPCKAIMRWSPNHFEPPRQGIQCETSHASSFCLGTKCIKIPISAAITLFLVACTLHLPFFPP